MKIAFLTAGGIAPCLSSSIGALIESYNALAPEAEMIGYLNGNRGLLQGKSLRFPEEVKTNYPILYDFGGSIIGNSRVKLTNTDDCVKRGYVGGNGEPIKVATNQLIKDQVDILHTIGGDDTNTTAKDLQNYINSKDINIILIQKVKL